MNLETKITIYKFTPQVFTLTPDYEKFAHGRKAIKNPLKLAILVGFYRCVVLGYLDSNQE